MNEKDFTEHVNTPIIVEQTDPDTRLAANSDPYGRSIPADGEIINETPDEPGTSDSAGLFNGEETEEFRTRWHQIQGKFVDEPRIAVEQADALVSEIVEKITGMFAEQQDLLEEQWKQGKEVSTEEMRKTLQNYRSFFNILVA
ncbi:MAG: hypothetical protein R6W69_16760 [Anaerolineales bacterium]